VVDVEEDEYEDVMVLVVDGVLERRRKGIVGRMKAGNVPLRVFKMVILILCRDSPVGDVVK
jgi:hypothetical protein